MNKTSIAFTTFAVLLLSLSLIPAQIVADSVGSQDSFSVADESSSSAVADNSRFQKIESELRTATEESFPTEPKDDLVNGGSESSSGSSSDEKLEETPNPGIDTSDFEELSIDEEPAQIEPYYKLDINYDCKIDELDLVHIQANLGRSLGVYKNGDVNGDGIIDSYDFTIFAGNYPVPANEANSTYIEGCEPSQNPSIDQLTDTEGDSNGDQIIDDADYKILKGYFGLQVIPGYNGDWNCDGYISSEDFNVLAGNSIPGDYKKVSSGVPVSCQDKREPKQPSPINPGSSGGNGGSSYINNFVPLANSNSKFLDFTGTVTQYSGDQLVKVIYYVQGLKVESQADFEAAQATSSPSIQLL